MGLQNHGSSSPSIFLCHDSDQPPCYNTLNHFCNRRFTDSSLHLPSFVISNFHPKACDLHYDRQNCHRYQYLKYFISPVSNSDRPLSNTWPIFDHSQPRVHRFLGWRVHKRPKIKISLVHPRHLRAFPNMHLVWFNANK
jgi:hypothetical protein